MPKLPKIRCLHIFALSPEKCERWRWFFLADKCKVFIVTFCVSGVCVCVCVCLFPFMVKASPDWTKTSDKCNARDQVSDGMLRKYFCVKNLYCHAIGNHSRDLQASNCAKECQLNSAEPREVKDNFLETNSKSMKHSSLPQH